MDASLLNEIISSYGFPIGAYILMFIHMKEIHKYSREDNASFREAIEQNTEVLIKLNEKLGGVEL